MNKQRQLGAVAAAVAMLVGASAFADQRPSRGTNRSEGGRIERRDPGTRAQSRVEVRGERPRRDDASAARRERSVDRSSASRERSEGRVDRSERRREAERSDRGRYESFDERRYSGRGRESYERRRPDHNRSQHYGGRPSYYSGRISRYERWNDGYRVWIGGAPYPFYVPLAYWRAGRFRIGVDIRLGGYYNPLGYYDYYHYEPYYNSYRSGRAYRTQELTGVVEDYDYRRRTALVRDDVTDRLIEVYFRSRDARLNHLRPGDYIEVEGGWTRGIFEVYRVFDVD